MTKPAPAKTAPTGTVQPANNVRRLDGMRDRAGSTAESLTATLQSNPLVALLSGLALGAAAGALLPRSAREKALLAPLGDRLAAAAEAAIDAGREAGARALEENDLSIEALRTQVAALAGQAGRAAGDVATAAFEAARDHAA